MRSQNCFSLLREQIDTEALGLILGVIEVNRRADGSAKRKGECLAGFDLRFKSNGEVVASARLSEGGFVGMENEDRGGGQGNLPVSGDGGGLVKGHHDFHQGLFIWWWFW